MRIERLETIYALYTQQRPMSWEDFLTLDWRDVEIWKAARRGKAIADRVRQRALRFAEWAEEESRG